MGTHVSALIDSIGDRWEEVDVLLKAAETNEKNSRLYNAICRSAVVLMTAHFEGFIKESARAIVEDANSHTEFKDLPEKMKKSFATYLVKSPNEDRNTKDLNVRVVRLTSLLEDLKAKIGDSAFLYSNDIEAPQKNPTPTFIARMFANFIDDDFFLRADQSNLEIAFTGDEGQLKMLKDDIVQHVVDGVENYPYLVDCAKFGLQSRGEITSKKGHKRTLWEEFLDEVFARRHSIAHGSSLENVSSLTEIKEIKQKIQTLQFALLLVLTHHATKPQEHDS